MVKLLRLCVDHGQERVIAALERLNNHDLRVEQVQAYLIPVSEPVVCLQAEVKVEKPQFKLYDTLIKKEAAL